MKVLLIYPYCLEDRLYAEDAGVVPIGLYYVGALLKANNYDVEILNWHDMRGKPGRIEAALMEKRPDVIGFSILHANRWGGIEIAKIAKRILPGVKTVFGGIGATFIWEHLLQHFPEIDYAVRGEGEYPFLELVRAVESGRGEELEQIPGLSFRRGEQTVSTPLPPPIKDLDRVPDPARYFQFQHVTSSRGCPGNCTFCGSPGFWGRRVRFHSPEYFVSQVERLYRSGIRFFFVSDDTFTLRADRVIEICRGLIESGIEINWAAISRVNLVNEEMLYWMRKAGCIQISYGVESGSPRIRRVLGKDIKTGDIKRAFSLTTAYGILARAYFIYGSPGECDETIQETLDLIDAIRPLSAIFYILDLFPGTALYEQYEKESGVTDDIWLERIEDIMYFETDPALSQEDILRFGERLRGHFYRSLPRFAEAVELKDDPELYPLHADFLSRLAMTFSHGDYAGVDEIPEKDATARKLCERALRYYPDHRAYLGLGILLQKEGAFERSVDFLSEGRSRYPESVTLAVCLAVSYMNLRAYSRALEHLLPFEDSLEALPHIVNCYQALGDRENRDRYRKKWEISSGH